MPSRIRLIVLLAALFLPAATYAQQRITCASGPDGRRVYCSADTRGGVTLVRPRGPARCRQGQEWGFDASGIWVERGCAAEFEVRPYRGGAWWWDSGKGHRPEAWHGTGACFYRDAGFQGAYFCLQRGESVDRLPPGFNDAITSIQVVRARNVWVFSKAGFAGYSGQLSDDVPNLRQWRLPGSSHTWNNRISSIRVE